MASRAFSFSSRVPSNRGVMDLGGLVLFGLAVADGNGDCHGRLNGEDVFALAGAPSFAAQVENPDFVAQPAHVLAHAAEGVAVQVA